MCELPPCEEDFVDVATHCDLELSTVVMAFVCSSVVAWVLVRVRPESHSAECTTQFMKLELPVHLSRFLGSTLLGPVNMLLILLLSLPRQPSRALTVFPIDVSPKCRLVGRRGVVAVRSVVRRWCRAVCRPGHTLLPRTKLVVGVRRGDVGRIGRRAGRVRTCGWVGELIDRRWVLLRREVVRLALLLMDRVRLRIVVCRGLVMVLRLPVCLDTVMSVPSAHLILELERVIVLPEKVTLLEGLVLSATLVVESVSVKLLKRALSLWAKIRLTVPRISLPSLVLVRVCSLLLAGS